MRSLLMAGLMAFTLFASGLPAGADSVPAGSAYYVNESNSPLVLSFSNLKGELSFSLVLWTDGNPAEKPWNVYIVYAGPKDRQDKQIQRIAFDTSYPDWVYMTLTDPALKGEVYLRFVIDDVQKDSSALAAFRNFSSTATYVSGGARPE